MLFVAVIAVFAAYQANWIRQRHTFLEKYAAVPTEFHTPKGMRFFVYQGSIPRTTSKHTFNLLWLFGESRRDQIQLVFCRDYRTKPDFLFGGQDKWALEGIPTDEIELAERLFPEADIGYYVYGVQPLNLDSYPKNPQLLDER
jgi:hypothetical protein